MNIFIMQKAFLYWFQLFTSIKPTIPDDNTILHSQFSVDGKLRIFFTFYILPFKQNNNNCILNIANDWWIVLFQFFSNDQIFKNWCQNWLSYPLRIQNYMNTIAYCFLFIAHCSYSNNNNNDIHKFVSFNLIFIHVSLREKKTHIKNH